MDKGLVCGRHILCVHSGERCRQAPLQSVQIQRGPQQQQVPSFLADKYEVSAYLDTVAQGINAVAKVEFRAQEVSQIVRVELHENLEVKDVKGADGKTLPFQREPQNPLYLVVTLPSPVPQDRPCR